MELGIVAGYAAAGTVAAGLSVALGRDPIATPSWVGLVGTESVAWSVVLGLMLAGATVLSSRILVRKVAWARELHEALRPAIRDLDGVTIAWMALVSGVGEELFFRGLLVPALGVWLSSLAFGALHQVRGPARWAWAGWAMAMGVLFALLFVITGSLLGAIVAHVAINAANLRFIRDVDSEGLIGPNRDPKLAAWERRSTSRALPPASVPRTPPRTTHLASNGSAGDSAPPRGSRSSA
jgi:membrane protease YdiL (CAAX protease family)